MDISTLTEKQLISLNHLVVDRLKSIRQTRTHKRMLDFKVGERVSFESDHGVVIGIISKFNIKTVSVITDQQVQWNVSPGVLMHSPYQNIKDVTPRVRKISQNIKISRNGPCPCGSGKKYKRCCA